MQHAKAKKRQRKASAFKPYSHPRISSRQQVLLQPVFQPTQRTLVFKPFGSRRANLPQEHATLPLAAINLQISVTNEQNEIVHLRGGRFQGNIPRNSDPAKLPNMLFADLMICLHDFQLPPTFSNQSLTTSMCNICFHHCQRGPSKTALQITGPFTP